jgi:hypothetical protein
MAGGLNTAAMLASLNKFGAQLIGQSAKGKKTVEVIVGYSAPYALYVHEDMTARHPNGQAKFLEQPMLQNMQVMADIITRSVKAKNGLTEGIKKAAEFLLQTSQPLVPVDTGALKASGFVQVV